MELRFGKVELFPPGLSWDFMKWRFVWIGISVTLVVISLLVVAIKGINYGIDFTGGTEITMTLNEGTTSREAILGAIQQVYAEVPEITSLSAVGKQSGSGFTIRLQRKKGADESRISEAATQISQKLKDTFGENKVSLSYANISGKVGKEEQNKGYLSVLFALIGILVYVAYRFDARFAPGAVLCLFHDVIIALGFMTALGRPFSNTSIAAFLTIVGYSIADTIIVYDRIREISLYNPRLSIVDVINKSINQTMSRTVLTQVTVWMALIVMVIWGGGAIFDFALTMLIGVIVGSYSSIYVSAPFTIELDNFFKKYGINISDANRVKKVKDPNYIPPVIIRKH